MRKTVMTFGLIAGAILSVMMFLTIPFLEKIGSVRGAILGYTTMVLAFLLIYFGIRSYRDNVAGGKVSFGRAFTVGFLIMGIASCCYVASWEFIYHYITPDFAEKYAAQAVAEARQKGATEEKIVQITKEMNDFAVSYKNPLVNIAYTFLEPLPVGLLFTLVSAGMLSRKKRPTAA